MKCRILHETKGRLRVHLCIGRMTLRQADLLEGHIFLPEPQAHPAPALMYDGRSHNRSLLMEKGSRLPAPFRGFSGLLAST